MWSSLLRFRPHGQKQIVQVTSPGLFVYSSLYQMKQHETIKDWNPRFAVEHGPIFFQTKFERASG
jgi:hypothetical protein